MKDCAPTTPAHFWRARLLAFLGAALVGLVVPSGCVVVPDGGYPTRESMKEFFLGSGTGCGCDQVGNCEATCGLPSGDCAAQVAAAPSDAAACGASCEAKPKFWHHLHLHHLHLYDPEAGIFNFCVPPQCLNPPPPLPPGRFFPVPVQPAFAQRADSGYKMVGSAYGSGNCASGAPGASAPCR